MSSSTEADRLILSRMETAQRIARRYPGRGVDREDLEGEAYVALCEAAQAYARMDQRPEPEALDRWIKNRIRSHLQSYVRDTLFAYLAGVPDRLKRVAIRAHLATERLAARGVKRPTYEHIAAEANLPLAKVLRVSLWPAVMVRQSAVEWCEDRSNPRAFGDLELTPAFGPQPGFTPLTPCEAIHHGPIPKGSRICCMVRYKTGVEGHPVLRRSRLTDPKPEPQTTAPPAPPKAAVHETRKERRQRLFASKAPQPAAG